uniref:Uncharacterized protein n=1 Tax=Anguilla anguilla TaxID=7936 RepID=A0A0E9UKF0_ANGAN
MMKREISLFSLVSQNPLFFSVIRLV